MIEPIKVTPLNGGYQGVYRFDNNFGASVVIGPYSYGGNEGLFELAVIKFYGPDSDDFHLCYDTPITDDVIGSLTESAVEVYLYKIKTLTPEGKVVKEIDKS